MSGNNNISPDIHKNTCYNVINSLLHQIQTEARVFLYPKTQELNICWVWLCIQLWGPQ